MMHYDQRWGPLTTKNFFHPRNRKMFVIEAKKVEQLGIEPRTSPMLREHYTTKPQPHPVVDRLVAATYSRQESPQGKALHANGDPGDNVSAPALVASGIDGVIKRHMNPHSGSRWMYQSDCVDDRTDIE
ncbi:hypothetical protein BJY04DRAFT_69391 [Aspergillus karnatakaensis]|uniref:uncharacterized protein n=1 Tax=Aspergillus karnatakaensis TaxID=1810916 RepID=UPI003CCD3BCB